MAHNHYIVGIAGGSASGKTSFLRQLKQNFPENAISVISQDNYYRPQEEQKLDENGKVNYDLPTAIDKDEFYNDIKKLLNGEIIRRKEYTFNNSAVEPEMIVVNPAPIIVIEGLFVFHYANIRHLLDLRLYLDVREEIQLTRRLKRDRDERGYPEQVVMYQWENHVLPSFKKFLKPYRDDAHIIVTNNISFEMGLLVLTEHLLYRLEKVLT